MQGGARKAAMAGFFFFTKKRLDGAASAPRRPPRSSGRPDDFADHSSGYPRPSRAAGRFYARQRPLRRHPPLPRARRAAKSNDASAKAWAVPPPRSRARRAGLTILPTIPADTRAPPARQAGFMAAATVAPPSSSPPARGRPQNRATQARKPGPRPSRPPRSSGRPDDFADHSCGYPRPSRAADWLYGGSDRCAAILAPRARQTGGAGRDAARRAALVRTAFSFAMEARCIRKGGGKGGAAQGETGAAAGRTVWKNG